VAQAAVEDLFNRPPILLINADKVEVDRVVLVQSGRYFNPLTVTGRESKNVRRQYAKTILVTEFDSLPTSIRLKPAFEHAGMDSQLLHQIVLVDNIKHFWKVDTSAYQALVVMEQFNFFGFDIQ